MDIHRLHHQTHQQSSLDHRKSTTKVKQKRRVHRVSLFVTIIFILLIELLLFTKSSHGAKSFYLHWNTTNPIFRIDNNDHVIDVNRGNVKFEYDQVHIICPFYEPGMANENETEKYIIYNVSKVEYETCRITNPNPRIIAICDKPFNVTLVTISFRPFTPQPGGLEFKPGNDYYFISTSSRDDIHRRIGGHCSTENTKVIFKVFGGDESSHKMAVTDVPTGHDKSPPHHHHHHNNNFDWKDEDSSESTNSEAEDANKIHFSSGDYDHATHRPFFINSNNVNNISGSKPTKKTNEHDSRQNEVVKNEELTYNNASSRSSLSAALSCLTVIVILIRNGRT